MGEVIVSGIAPTHRHKKSGGKYELLGFAKMQTAWWYQVHGPGTKDEWGNIYPDYTPVDMREVAVYRSVTDPTEIWVRPREEFEDGRFEDLRADLEPTP
jgi:hypothetical protein